MKRYKIVILTSGKSRGSNFVAIANHLKRKRLPVDISAVIVTSKTAPVIEKCQELSISHYYLSCKDIAVYQQNLKDLVEDKKIDLIVLAGFMKLLESDFISSINIPILNIHPALLPKFGGKGMYGMNVHQAVFSQGERYSGITIHQVNGEYDKGDIIFQKRIRIHRSKSPEIIAHKVLKEEHKHYGRVIYQFLKAYYE
ncbi:phosphoribosylglycinamide formyltransferase [bacterium]|nr:phosphoribosylglycinamide formyltransferase [bacterium]